VTYWFTVGRLSCAVVSDGQMEPPLAPPLETFITPGTGVPDRDLREALAAEGQGRTMVKCGYNCLLVETPDGRAVIDTGMADALGSRRGAIVLSRRRLLGRAADENLLVHAYHMPFPDWAGSSGTAAPSGGSRRARAAPGGHLGQGFAGAGPRVWGYLT
jgi:hypothetical protein